MKPLAPLAFSALLLACTRHHDAPPDAAPPAVATPAPPAPPSPRAWTVATRLHAPPFRLPDGVADVVAHVPEGLDAAAPLHLVVFFHGSGACIAQMAMSGDVTCTPGAPSGPGAGLAWRQDDAGTQSIFAAPQLGWGGGAPGRFAEAGYLRAFVEELLASTFAPGLGGPRTLADVADVTLVAFSAGHIPLAALLDRGDDLDDRVRHVVLLDALYEDPGPYLRWLARERPGAPRKLVSVHGPWGGQPWNAAALARARPGSAVDPPGALEDAIRAHAVTTKTWPLDHGWMPLLLFTKVIAGLGLPPRDVTPPRTVVASTARQPAPAAAEVRGTLDDGDELLENGAAADDYAVSFEAGERVVIDVAGGPSRTENAALDTYVQVLADGVELAHDDDSGGFFDPHLEFTAPHAGTFVVRVTNEGSGMKRGPYVLHLRSRLVDSPSHAPFAGR